MDNSNNSGKVIGALLLGAAIGGALGILFAPDKGSETRKKITGKGEDLTDALKEKFNEFLETLNEKVESAKEDCKDTAKKGKEVKDKVASAMN